MMTHEQIKSIEALIESWKQNTGREPSVSIFNMAMDEALPALRAAVDPWQGNVPVPINDLLEFCKAARDLRKVAHSRALTLSRVRHDRLEAAEKRIGELIAPYKQPLMPQPPQQED